MCEKDKNLFQSKKDQELICRSDVKMAFHIGMEANQIMPGSPDYDYFMEIIDSVPAYSKK